MIETYVWFWKNTRSLLVQTRLSLEKHEPENASEHWKTTVTDGISGIFALVFVLYIVFKNADNIGKLKQ